MQSNKKIILMAILVLLIGTTFAQKSTSGYDVYDSSVITRKGRPQQNEFWNNAYNFPSKPRNMWEVGLSGGLFNLSSDVPTVLPTFGFSAHVRKSIGYVLSLRLQYLFGMAEGMNWNASANFSKNTAWNQLYSAKTTTGTTIPGRPAEMIYYNYKNKTQDLSLQALFTLNNIRFHKNQSKFIVYGGAGFGATAYRTMINAKNESTGEAYNDLFANVYNNTLYKYTNRKTILKDLRAGMDKTYETNAETYGERRPKLGNQTLQFSTSLIIGAEYKLSKRVNLALENRHVSIKDDLLDGQQWQEHPDGDAVLTSNWDSYNYLSLGLNFNLGSKAVEPLWWINPLDYVYGELNHPRHTQFPKPSFDDDDDDGVVNQLDREPNTPAGAKVDTHGVSMDTDGDGVPDYKDKQLITPTECQPVNADGVGTCPDPECCKHPVVECPTDYPSLKFKENSADLTNDLKSLLKQVAAKLLANSNCKIMISGYPQTSKAAQAFCVQRMDKIKEYLKSLNVVEDRVSTNCVVGGGDANTVDIKSN